MKRLMWAGSVVLWLGCGPTESPEAAEGSQAPNEPPAFAWTHSVEDGKNDARGVVAGPDGGIVLVGNTEVDRDEGSEAWVLHLDRYGEQVFKYPLGGGKNDELYAVCSDGFGGWIVGGTKENPERDFWISRLDEHGDILWEIIHGGEVMDWVNAIVRSADGMLIVAGVTASMESDDYDGWVAKVDIDGNVIWEITREGDGSDQAQGLAATVDGGAIVSGHTNSRGQGESDVWAFSVDTDGVVLWDRTYGGSGEEVAYGIVSTEDGGFVLAGNTVSVESGLGDALILKIDEQGEEVWSRAFESETDDWMHAITSTPSGDFVAAGTKDGGIWIIGLDGQGELLWEQALPADARDVPVGITYTSDGALGVVGFKVYDGDVKPWDAWVWHLGPGER